MTKKSDAPAIRFKGFSDAWEQRKFYKLYEKVSRKNDLTYGKNDIISVANMYFKSDSYITDESYLLTYNIFELGDIAFEGNKSKNYAHGRFVENTIGNGIVSHVFDVFRPIMKPYDLLFWKYAINNEKLMGNILLRSTKASTMMTNLVANDFLQEEFSVPTYAEQKKIGAFFQQLDNLITLHQRKYEKLTNVKKSMLEKMFPQNGSSFPEIRFKGFTDAWEQRKLGDISEIKTGPFGSTLHADDYVSDGTPIITTEHFKTGALPRSKNGLPQVSDSDYKRLTAYTLDAGDIVFSRVGSVDINALITPFQSNWLFSGRVLRVRPQTDVSSQFLHTRLETESIKTDIRTRAVGQTMPSINTEILKITPLVLPSSVAEQEQIGSYFAALDNLITLHQRKLEKLQNIKKSMLEKMFV